jgi:PIN domain nuclease of toxin-antitoxin system
VIYLLDTQIVVWAALETHRLRPTVRALLEDPTNGFMFSSVVIWEVTIKAALGRKGFTVDPRLLRRGLLNNGAAELAITSDHGLAVADLPPLHKDPFDRIQVAQARVEGLVFLTADDKIAAYGSPVELV